MHSSNPATRSILPPHKGPWKANVTLPAPPPPPPPERRDAANPKPARVKKISRQTILSLIKNEFPEWGQCLDEFLKARRSHPQEDIVDQVAAIWQHHGFTRTPMIPQMQALKIWKKIPKADDETRPICSDDAIGVTAWSFISRAFALGR